MPHRRAGQTHEIAKSHRNAVGHQVVQGLLWTVNALQGEEAGELHHPGMLVQDRVRMARWPSSAGIEHTFARNRRGVEGRA